MAKKKPTVKELEAKVEVLTRVNNIVVKSLDDLGGFFRYYIEFKKDTDDFKGWMDEKRKIRQDIMGGKKYDQR